MLTKNLCGTLKNGGEGAMVWGCISAAGVRNLCFIEGNMEEESEQSISDDDTEKSIEDEDFYIGKDKTTRWRTIKYAKNSKTEMLNVVKVLSGINI
ncbi:hypothetical protein AVEN_77065-1 [Araneus ventricosus]|uniref:Uncharacterized protein n=1 Tax=Araneus ventricosus TaxID=182803 RepID=A0A4Y2G5J5_ARAVE|nr:hypothetical protein AVEN_77065-1 [Araneus ventricosus]